jgi:hypothetical protein
MPESRINYILDASQVPGEAAKAEKSFQGIERSARAAGVAGATGLTNVERSSKGATVAASQLDQIYQNVVRTQGAGSAAAQQLAAAMNVSTVAAKANTVATEANVVAHVATEAASSKAGEGFSRLTNRINVGRGALAGYDAAIEGVVRAFGGIQLGFAIFIGLAAALLPKIISLINAKKEMIEVDADVIKLNIEINKSLDTGTNFTQAYARVLHDQTAAKVNALALSQQLKTAEDKEAASVRANGEAVAGQTSWYGVMAASVLNATSGLIRLSSETDHATQSQAESSAERQKVEQATIKWLDAEIKIAAAQGQTRQQVEEATKAIFGQGTALQVVTELLNQGALASERFRQGQALISRTKLNVSQEAAAAGETLTHAEAVRRLAQATAGLTREEQKLAKETLLTEKNLKALNDEHVRKAKIIHDIGPQLELESLRASIALNKEDFALREQLIKREFEVRREEMVKNKQATETNLAILKTIEVNALTALTNEHVAYYLRINEERNKDLTRQREFREKEVLDFGQHLAKQRQMREDEERKFFENQAKLEHEAALNRLKLSDQPGRAESQRKAEIDAVTRAFGFASENAKILRIQLEALRRFDTGDFLGGAVLSIKALGLELIRSGQLFQMFGQAVAGVFEGIVSGTETAKSAFLKFIAQLLMMAGQMAIALGTIYLFTPGFHGLGIALIAAGIAAMALAGVINGLAANAGKNAAAAGGSGSSSAGGSTAGSGRPEPVNNLIPFNTSSGGTTVVENHFHLDKGTMRGLLIGDGFMTTQTIRGQHNGPLKAAVKTKGK